MTKIEVLTKIPYMSVTPSEAITLRGHTLLCLQGFRGEGYNARFTERLSTIHKDLTTNPNHLVKVIQAPDTLCEACPNLGTEGCQVNGSGSEREMSAQDTDVMTRLGIDLETTLPWKTILDRIGQKIQGSHLSEICGDCRWLPLGYCHEGIDVLGGKGS